MQQLIDIDITSWDYSDGSVGAQLDAYPAGNIWAKDEETLHRAIIWIMNHLQESVSRKRENNGKIGMLGGGMQGAWIDGAFTVRWLPLPGFGVSFPSNDGIKEWLKVLLRVALQAQEA